MSRRRIKSSIRKPKKPKGSTSIRSIMEMGVQAKRDMKKEDDNTEVVLLITEEKLNLESRYDYKYMAPIARELGWSMGRLTKATERVAKLLKAEEKEDEDSV